VADCAVGIVNRIGNDAKAASNVSCLAILITNILNRRHEPAI
jgi:hypothetical protein